MEARLGPGAPSQALGPVSPDRGGGPWHPGPWALTCQQGQRLLSLPRGCTSHGCQWRQSPGCLVSGCPRVEKCVGSSLAPSCENSGEPDPTARCLFPQCLGQLCRLGLPGGAPAQEKAAGSFTSPWSLFTDYCQGKLPVCSACSVCSDGRASYLCKVWVSWTFQACLTSTFVL